MIEAGEPAPDFTLPDQDGEPVSLSQFEGSPVVVYFYPADDTPGCTTQACGIRDHWEELRAAGAVVLGVSPDGPESHRAFREKHGLPHILLSDPGHEVMERYDAYGEKVLYGKRSVGVKRSTVLVGPDGRIVKHWKRAQAGTHAERVLTALDQL